MKPTDTFKQFLAAGGRFAFCPHCGEMTFAGMYSKDIADIMEWCCTNCSVTVTSPLLPVRNEVAATDLVTVCDPLSVSLPTFDQLLNRVSKYKVAFTGWGTWMAPFLAEARREKRRHHKELQETARSRRAENSKLEMRIIKPRTMSEEDRRKHHISFDF